jgi:murein L,D-transpeptidase YafK
MHLLPILHITLITVALAASGSVHAAQQRRAEIPRGFDPEPQLAKIYQEIGRMRMNDALRLTDELIAQAPNFRLAHLIRGDLLLARAHPVKTFGAAPAAPADKIADLREEALSRLKAYRERPPANKVPRYLLQLRPDQKTALVVDTKRSRLYVYRNNNGQPQFVADFYVSQGKNGIFKMTEGDQRTPIGVYTITDNVPGYKLIDFYGKGALPLNYPNDWDKLHGRGGSGIWLHGVPSDTFSRPPRSSDGCVVLANADLRKLARLVQVGATPVVISETVEWLSLDDWHGERQSLSKAIEKWRTDWESLDFVRYAGHYSRGFKNDSGNLEAWLNARRELMRGKQWTKVGVKNISMFRYPGAEEMVMIEFVQSFASNDLNTQLKKRQYWRKENGVWRIAYEGNLAS